MALKNHQVLTPEESGLPLSTLPEGELLRLRHQIDEQLGAKNLAGLDIEQEIILQLRTAKALQADVLDDNSVPANQRAQTVNTVSSILIQLVKTQTDLYNAERIKELEASIIEAMREAEDDVKERFFERYERLLAAQEAAK